MPKFKVGDIVYGLDTQKGYTLQIERILEENRYGDVNYKIKYLEWPALYNDLYHGNDEFNAIVLDEYFIKTINYNHVWEDVLGA